MGYTAVDVTLWDDRSAIDDGDHSSFGIAARGLLAQMGSTSVGIEIGQHRLFSYRRQRVETGGVVIQTNVVQGIHFMAFGRVLETRRFFIDLGAGFQGTGDASVPMLTSSASFVVLRSRRVSVPLGIRGNLIMSEPAFAAAVAAKLGISIALDRVDDAP